MHKLKPGNLSLNFCFKTENFDYDSSALENLEFEFVKPVF